METNQIRVLIADSHDLFRQGLASLLSRQPGVVVVGEARDGEEAMAMATNLQPAVLLMEMHMHKSEGLPTVVHIMEKHPMMSVAILTSSEEDNDLPAAVKAGVKGYMLKNSSLDELVRAVHALAQGGAYFSS